MRLLKKEKTYKDIVYYILSENLKIGDRVPTENDFCEKFGVSRITLRTAIDRLVEEGVLQRQGRNGTILTALPENSEDALSAGVQKKILFVYFAKPKQAFTFLEDTGATPERLYIGIEKFINERGDVIMVQAGVNFITTSKSLLDSVDGVILGGEVPVSALKNIREAAIPFVIVDMPRYTEVCDTVSCDYYEAGYLAVKKTVADSEKGNLLFLGLIYEGEKRMQPSYSEIIEGVKEYVNTNKHLTLLKYFISMQNDRKSEIAKFAKFLSSQKVDYIVACSAILEEYLLLCADLPEFNDFFKKFKICVISPDTSGKTNEKIIRISLDTRQLGYMGAARLYERIANPTILPVRIALPVQP